jgi:hypothetical protein
MLHSNKEFAVEKRAIQPYTSYLAFGPVELFGIWLAQSYSIGVWLAVVGGLPGSRPDLIAADWIWRTAAFHFRMMAMSQPWLSAAPSAGMANLNQRFNSEMPSTSQSTGPMAPCRATCPDLQSA